jgi:glycosyltransferase involved in cell wall biosynthesis
MQQEYFPEFFSASELKQRKRTYKESVEGANAIITISAHAKKCIVENYDIDPLKVHIIYSGCGREFFIRKTGSLSEITKKYNIRPPFIFYPAATWPHKNHARLLMALKLLVDKGEFDGELVLSGAQRNAHGDLVKLIKQLRLEGKVRWLGYLPQDALPKLYNAAKIMVFPSLFEGFGLPVVEAMASGCPVVCSQNSSLPEVGGKAAIYFDPLQVESIAEQISLVWNRDEIRETMRQKGLLQASLFRWEKTAKETVDLYHNVLQQAW